MKKNIVLIAVSMISMLTADVFAKPVQIAFRSAALIGRVRETDDIEVTIWDKDGKQIIVQKINSRSEGDKIITIEAPTDSLQDFTVQAKDIGTGNTSPFYNLSVPYVRATGLFFKSVVGVHRPGKDGNPSLYDINNCNNCFYRKFIQKP